MPAFYIAPEASIPYTIVSPTGARAVLNDPTDPDFCGYLDGEDAISGIDSPEIRDTYADLVEAEGGLGGTNFFSRRPIVMNGIVLPTSATDRNTKLGKLMAATDARYADGTLSWTPTGGEPVFLRFRRQLPFRATGGFNKKFQIGLVANDPRIYTVRSITTYTETNGNSTAFDYRRITRFDAASTELGYRVFYLPPGSYRVELPVRLNQASMAAYLWTDGTNGAGNTSAAAVSTWNVLSRSFTKATSEATPFFVVLYTSSLLTSSNYAEMGDFRIYGLNGEAPSDAAPFAANWLPSTGYTLSFQSATPFTTSNGEVLNPGNTPAPPRQRMIGPFSGAYATQTNGAAQIGLYPSSAYSSSDYAVINHATKTIKKNNSTSDIGSLEPIYSRWAGISNDQWIDGLIMGYTGASTATRLETTFRGTWL